MDVEGSPKRRRVEYSTTTVGERCKSLAFDYIQPGMRLTPRAVDCARRANTSKLLRERKLVLILDLDQTLLHSKAATGSKRKLLSRFARSRPDACLFRSDSVWTKLRPLARDFLREAREFFDMYLYTNGRRAYAMRMSKLLDPAGEYFGSKVIAREDSTVPKRKALDVVLVEERLVVILDDTCDVWPDHKQNLITAPRYTFFQSQQTVDQNDSDYELEAILDRLKLIHMMFFDRGFDQGSRTVAQLLRIINSWKRIKPSAEAAET